MVQTLTRMLSRVVDPGYHPRVAEYLTEAIQKATVQKVLSQHRLTDYPTPCLGTRVGPEAAIELGTNVSFCLLGSERLSRFCVP